MSTPPDPRSLAGTPPSTGAPSTSRAARLAWHAAAALLGFASLFWSLYFLRLLVVTHVLTRVRGGGWGAYIGAVAFPALAAILGFGSWWAARRSRGAPTDPHLTR